MLSVLVWLPIAGVLVIGLWPHPQAETKHARPVALVVASAVLIWTIFLAVQFNPDQATMQFGEFVPWIEAIGFNYH